MTHNQFPAYEFDPTLTTSELNALVAEREASEAEADSRLDDERFLRELERRIAEEFNAYIANPTIEGAKALASDVDFHSDIYKDVHNVRPHGRWDAYFVRFGQAHKDVWALAYNA